MIVNAIKRMVRRPATVLILFATFTLLAIVVATVQNAVEKRQEDIENLARNTEVWCVLSDRATGRTDQLQVTYEYAQGSYYENLYGMRDYMKRVRIVTHMNEVETVKSQQPVDFVGVNSKDAWAPLRDSRLSLNDDWTELFLDGSEEACVISDDLISACSDGKIILKMPDDSISYIPVAGTIADRENTVIVPWQVYRDVYAHTGNCGQSLDEFSFLVADNTKLSSMCNALQNLFVMDNAVGESASEILLIQDLQYQQNMLFAKRNLIVVQLISPLLMLCVMIMGWGISYLLFRVRSWEQILLMSLGYSSIAVVAASMIEVSLSCSLGWLVSIIMTPHNASRISLILCSFLLGAIGNIVHQVHRPIMQQLKKKEA